MMGMYGDISKESRLQRKESKSRRTSQTTPPAKAALTRMIKKAREDGTFDSLPDDIKAKCLKHEAKREKAAYFYNQWKEKQAYAARREEVAGIDELSLQHFKSI